MAEINNNMGQARKRGTFEERLAQALTANATLEAQLRENSDTLLRKFIEKQGVQRFRQVMGMHLGQSNDTQITHKSS
jgi:hypothetical protein